MRDIRRRRAELGTKASGSRTVRERLARSKRDSSAAQPDSFARANEKEKASVCSGRNDRWVVVAT